MVLYTDLVDACFLPGHLLIRRCYDREFLINMFARTRENDVGQGLNRLLSLCLTAADDARNKQQRILEEQKARRVLEMDLKSIELEIRDLQELKERIEGRLRKIQADRVRASRVLTYANEKRRELRELEEEIKVYSAILDDQSLPDESDQEIRILQSKAKKYDLLLKQITSLKEGRIERRHLEKNIEGLAKEIGDLKSGRELDKKTLRQIKVYEAEMRRLRKSLAQSDDKASEISRKEEELSSYAEAHHRLKTLNKSRRLVSQNDVTKVKVLHGKAQNRLRAVQDELNELNQQLVDHADAALEEEALSQQQTELKQREQELSAKRSALQKINPSAIGSASYQPDRPGVFQYSVRSYLDAVCGLWQQFIDRLVMEDLRSSERDESGGEVSQKLMNDFVETLPLNAVGNASRRWSDGEASLLALGMRRSWSPKQKTRFILLDDDLFGNAHLGGNIVGDQLDQMLYFERGT